MNKVIEKYKVPLLLIDPKYRIWRYLIFIMIGAIITFNQVFIAYQDCSNVLGNRIYVICFSSFLQYLAAMCFNYYFLIPRYLLKGKFVSYSVILSLGVFLLPTLAVLQEGLVRNLLELPHRVTSYTNPLIMVDNLATFMNIVICFWGISALVLFRNWLVGNERVSQLEYEHLQSEVNKLKGQITPGFLSRTLTNTSALVKTDPKKTSDMLMQLGQLLRYQLYDCNRDKVFLKSEINFLNNFLKLEQLNRNEFKYTIETEGDLNNVIISPLLLITLVQGMIDDSTYLNLDFRLRDQYLLLRCQSATDKEIIEDEVVLIKKRLELLYQNKYTLLLNTGFVELQLDILEE
ncbi:MAG: histidine kinase [Prevotella sp.]|nr:histidine kinase [Prevotella sp.]